MPLNIELLEKVKAHIIADPESFDMQHWWCGSAGCIGGWAAILSGVPEESIDSLSGFNVLGNWAKYESASDSDLFNVLEGLLYKERVGRPHLCEPWEGYGTALVDTSIESACTAIDRVIAWERSRRGVVSPQSPNSTLHPS